MPKVGKKKYPYNDKGKKPARRFAKKKNKKVRNNYG